MISFRQDEDQPMTEEPQTDQPSQPTEEPKTE